jgi:hypothetical protein
MSFGCFLGDFDLEMRLVIRFFICTAAAADFEVFDSAA